MSAFQELASPALPVEPARAEKAFASGDLKVEPAAPSEDAIVEPVMRVEPAVTDEHKNFAPPITKEEASHLSVTALRGSGSDFESKVSLYHAVKGNASWRNIVLSFRPSSIPNTILSTSLKAGVVKGGVQKNFLRKCFPFLFDERDFISMGEVLRYVFVKANCIFVYGQETDPSPLYAIQLETVRAIEEDPKNPDNNSFTISPRIKTNETGESLVTILLKDRKSGKQAYQFTFDTTSDKSVGKRFLDVINFNLKQYGSEIVTASVVRAKAVGKAAMTK